MSTYRWTHETPLVRHATDEVITDGQLFEPTPHERRQWSARMVKQATEAVDVCTTEKNDGEICGRELPCRFHSDDYTPKGERDE